MDLVTHARRTGALLLLVLTHAQAHAEPPIHCGTQKWQPLIEDAAVRFDIPAAWIDAVMRAESAGCTHMKGHPMVSSAGAMGLMQLMPATWQEFRKRLQLGDDPHDPRDNILAGAAYLRDLHDAYGEPGLFAAYHAGPARFKDYLLDGRSLPHATVDYVNRVQKPTDPTIHPSTAIDDADRVTTPELFVLKRRATRLVDQSPNVPTERALFVPLQRARQAVDHAAQESDHVQER
jgi:hypothetical protein